MDQEELNLINEYRYRSYSATIDKALKNFESSSEWADLISSLGKLNKALQSNLKYSLLPRRLIISKRLAQCLHPALPIGVHLKALETYEIIFKIIGIKWLAKDLFFYSSGLFPLLGNAAMSVKPVLLGLYEKYYLPLQKSLNPSLQAFITGLLPGLEEGSEIYDRTDILLQRLVLVVGQEVFYGALWGSVIVSPSIRLPASLFIVSHINKSMQRKDQKYVFGSDPRLAMKGLCASVKDSNVLVQRNALEILFYFFPLCTCLDLTKSVIPMTRAEMVHILSDALHAILRRDMSLNRRLYAWLLGTDIKGGFMTSDTNVASEDEGKTYFDEYSRDLLVRAMIKSLQEVNSELDQDHGPQVHLKPFRILISLLDKPDLGPQVIGDLLLEVIRAFYSICRQMLDLDVQSNQNESLILSKMTENKNTSEVIKTVNVLINSLSTDYLWDFVTGLFVDSVRNSSQAMSPMVEEDPSPPPTVEELCTLLVFLLEVIPLELYTEIQTQYLPQMLCHIVRCLMENIEILSLQELTKSLKMCCVTISKIQLPAALMDTEAGSAQELPVTVNGRPSESPLREEMAELLSDGECSPEEGVDAVFPPLQSEDSGIGLSVVLMERPRDKGRPKVSSQNTNVWRSGGSVQTALRDVQRLLAHFALKYIFRVSCQAQREEEKTAGHLGKKALAKKQITVPQFKQMLSEFFSVRGPPLKQKKRQRGFFTQGSKGDEGWDADRMLQEVEEVAQECRLAFTAICQLLLDYSTFPIYMSFREIEALHSSASHSAGDGDACLPLWLKSLMILSCCISDCHLQNVAISSLLEIINHSHSLALVIEDKVMRYKSSEYKAFVEKLQLITAPPIAQATLKVIAESTNFYQRAAHVLWNQLGKESREHHSTCVELFYKLHCIAPSANLCEDIICQALLHKNKGIRLETLFRFSVLWHFTRDIQRNRTSFCTRSFDRCLFVVLDSLNCSDGAIGASAQGWLVRALSLNDVSRILEPVFLLLLHPKTQRNSIQCLKKKVMGEDVCLLYKVSDYPKTFSTPLEVVETSSEESFKFSRISSVDRDMLWAEVEGDPDRPACNQGLKKNTNNFMNRQPQRIHPEESKDSSEHTESIDTSSGALSSGVTSSASPQSPENHDTTSTTDDEQLQVHDRFTADKMVNNDTRANNQLALVHTDSERTQMSQSLSSDEEEIDLEMQLITREKVLKHQREKLALVEALFKHILLYIKPYDSKRVLYAFSVLEAVLKTTPKEFIEALSATLLDNNSNSQLNLVHNLLARHQEALLGLSFYGKLPSPGLPVSHRQSSLMELLTYICLNFLRSYYPCQMTLSHKDLLGNRDVQVNSVQVLVRIVTQLIADAKSSEGKKLDVISSWLTKCKVQEYVLLSLSASMYLSEKSYTLSCAQSSDELVEEGLSEENLVNFGEDQIWSEHPLQIELLKLLQVLVVLEHHLGQTADDHEGFSDLSKEWHKVKNFQSSITAMGYVQSQPITAQGMFVSAVVRALQPQYGYSIHPPWVSLVTLSLPYLGKSLGLVVAPFVAQVCRNLDDLVRQYENEDKKSTASATSKKENIPPDYPLTLLEGLTTISHYCLLDVSAQARKSATLGDSTSLKNAKNAILEELPLIIDSMSCLWGVVQREESQKKPTNSLSCMSKGSSSVYFKSTKTLRQKILELLNPFAAQMGVHLMAAVATVWNKKKSSKKVNQNKVLAVASEAQLTLVDLVQALATLNTDSILQLIKEVVKKPPQTKGEEKPTLVDIPMLQFSLALLQRLSIADLQDVLPSLLYLLKESVQLNLAPPGHFLLLGILNYFISRNPNLENKKDQRDLQEVAQKIIDAVGNVVGSSLEQTSWLSRNLEVKAGPQVYLEDANSDAAEDGSLPPPSAVVSTTVASLYSVQALTLLAELLAHLLDIVYRSDEKEKAVPLISRLLYYVFPYMRNHSVHNIPSFRAAAQLLSSLSGYAYTKRAWKKEAFDLFMDPLFFQMDSSCINYWKSIIDHLLTHEKTMFKDLMSMQSSSLKLFANYEQKAMLVKRQAFAIFSGEVDQYHLYLPLIQERLTETLRVGMSSVVTAQIFLTFRVLLTRISPQHLTSLWPIMVTELVQVFIQLEEDLLDIVSNKVDPKSPANHGNGPHLLDLEPKELDMYLSACKFLDTALCFPQEVMPLFQMYRWAFVPEVDIEDCSPHVDIAETLQAYKPYAVRILDILNRNFGEMNCEEHITSSNVYEFPLLTQRSVSSIQMLAHFFRVLCRVFKTQPIGGPNVHNLQDLTSPTETAADAVLRRIEENVAFDFLEMTMEH